MGWAGYLFGFHAVLGLASLPSVNESVLEHPAGRNSAQVELTAFDGRLYMSWLESEDRHKGRLLFSVYDGHGWSRPGLIVESDRLFINWADFPKLAVTESMMVAVWPEMNGTGTYSYGLRFSVSHDRGGQWLPPAWLHEDRSPTEHGFVSMAPAGKDRVAALWLDGRAMDGGHGEGGAMQLRSRTIDADRLGPERLVDDGTCECCGTDLVSVTGTLVAAYRNKTEDHVRDIFLARNDGEGWSGEVAIHDDGWRIHGCPVNGPALAVNGASLAAAWFSAAPQAAVHLKLSRDGGGSFAEHRKMGKEPLGRVDCAFLSANRLALTWLEAGDERGAIMLAAFETGPNFREIVAPRVVDHTGSGRASGFARLAVIGDELFVAYQDPEQQRIKIKRIGFEMP